MSTRRRTNIAGGDAALDGASLENDVYNSSSLGTRQYLSLNGAFRFVKNVPSEPVGKFCPDRALSRHPPPEHEMSR